MSNGLLEVAVGQVRDVPGAVEGGAHRLSLETGEPGAWLSPNLALASAVLRESDVPVRVTLRLNDGYTTTGGEFTRLIGLAEEYLALGAEGVAFGFLTADLDVDKDTCAALANALPGVAWTFHSAIDAALDPRRSWRDLVDLPGLSAVNASGSLQGLAQGYDELLALAESDPRIGPLLMPGEGLLAEQVPWFVAAGVRQFRVAQQVRPGASYKSYVEAGLVRSWRRLVDSAMTRAG